VSGRLIADQAVCASERKPSGSLEGQSRGHAGPARPHKPVIIEGEDDSRLRL